MTGRGGPFSLPCRSGRQVNNMPAPSLKRRSRRSPGEATLTLTSLMDMFTIILLFLLVSYSTEGEMATADPKFKLPVSTSLKKPDMRLIIQVTPDEIIIDGGKVAEVKEAIENQDYIITPLLEALDSNTKKVEFIAMNNPSFKFKGDVIVQGDRRIPFILLEKIMVTCGQAGYGNISLAVLSRE